MRNSRWVRLLAYVTGSVNYDNLVEGSGIEAERFTIAIPKGAKIQGIR